MWKLNILLFFIVFSSEQGIAQIKFPYPVNTEFYERSAVLMPDSSIVLFSNREKSEKFYQFVFDHRDSIWKNEPSRLSTIINGLILNKQSECYIRFSKTFTKALVSISQFPKNRSDQAYTRFFIIKKQNEEWSLPKEMMIGNPLNLWRVISFANDEYHIYGAGNDPHVLLLEESSNGWFVKDTVGSESISKLMTFVIQPLAIGKNGLLFLGSLNHEVSKDGFAKYYYSKVDSYGKWSAPVFIKELDHKGGVFGVTLSPNGKYLVYSKEQNIELIDIPELFKSRIDTNLIFKSSTNLLPELEKGVNKNFKSTIVKSGGSYYALLIGNSDYQLNEFDLDNPVQDVEKLSNVLNTLYQFDEKNVIKLINSDRNTILKELYRLRKTLTPEDNLLIFYAGHGHWDEQIGQGYWWPVDATPENPSNWLSNSDLREQIRGINSAHTLLISDACFSGGIFKTRGAGDIRLADRDIQLLYRMPSRRAITSGTMSSVPDKSVFFKYLIKYLTENDKKFISSSELFTTIRKSVLNNSLTVPQDGVILNTGDEGGDFIFIKK